MGNANEELVTKGYELFNSGDMDGLAAIYADDAVHVFPGKSQLSGEYKDREGCFQLYGKLGELSGGTFRAPLDSVTAKGNDGVVGKHRHTATRDGKSIDVGETLTFTIKDGKITRLDSSFDDQAAVDEFWA